MPVDLNYCDGRSPQAQWPNIDPKRTQRSNTCKNTYEEQNMGHLLVAKGIARLESDDVCDTIQWLALLDI